MSGRLGEREMLCHYLTIRLCALGFFEVIVDEAEAGPNQLSPHRNRERII